MVESSISSNASTVSTDESTEENNPFLLPTEQAQSIFAGSKHIWQSYLETAKSMHHIMPDSLNLSSLHRLPTLPDDLEGVKTLQGRSTWRQDSCLLHLRHGTKQQWQPTLSTGCPTVCKFSSNAPFSNWPDETNLSNRMPGHNNGVFIMLVGWVYILSKKLLEKQCLQMHFSKNRAGLAEPDKEAEDNIIIVDIGEVTPDELRWWRALLAPGPGWRTPPWQQPPWAITLDGDLTFRIATSAREFSSYEPKQPPSSAQAIEFLSRFAARHCLGIQSSAALAMALTLPLHNAAGSIVLVPKPTLGEACILPIIPGRYCHLVDNFQNISRYMTLSSNPRFLSSALWSIFWEPGIECNAVSPWCDGIIEVLEPIVNNSNFELLGHIFALRRPNLAALWYAIVLFGQTTLIDAIIPFLKTLRTPTPTRPIPEVAFWTGVPQSFMDLPGAGPYLREDYTISRADVWRLRHDCWELEPEGHPFNCTPLFGWPPIGTMYPEDLELEVRKHIDCKRHKWQYDKWTWELENKEYIYEEYKVHQDCKCEPNSNSSFQLADKISYEPNNIATRKAVQVAFSWSATEIEFPNQAIYTHSWVGADYLSEGGNPDLSTDALSLYDKRGKDVELWVEAVAQHSSDFEKVI